MSVGSADVIKKIVSIWNASGLNAQFQAYWSSADQSDFPVLNDTEAEGSHPFPYCVFECGGGHTSGRSSGPAAYNMENRELPLSFVVHARDTGGALSAKQIAANLIEEIMKVFGGHPTTGNQVDDAVLDNGGILISTYKNDWGIREGIENWAWKVMYSIVVDVPAAV